MYCCKPDLYLFWVGDMTRTLHYLYLRLFLENIGSVFLLAKILFLENIGSVFSLAKILFLENIGSVFLLAKILRG